MITFKQFIETKEKLGQSKAAQKFGRSKGPVKIEVGKTSLGHQPHTSGTGYHGKKGKKTRGNQNKAAIRDSIE